MSKKSRKSKKESKKEHGGMRPELVAKDELTLFCAEYLLRTKPRKSNRLWGPLIRQRQIGMLFGMRGAGKTMVTLGIAVSAATGVEFLGHAPKRPCKVVILDGEMGAEMMRERLLEMQAALGAGPLDNIYLITPDLYKHVMPSLATAAGQAAINAIIPDDVDLVIVDNVAAFNHGGREDADGWSPWAEWMLAKKHAGCTVLIVHHANKSGGQRGTSRREDNLDFVIKLEQVDNPEHPGALSVTLSWDKLRSVAKSAAPTLQVTRVESDDGTSWVHKELPSLPARRAQALEMREQGKTFKQIGEAMGVDASTVMRWLRDLPKP